MHVHCNNAACKTGQTVYVHAMHCMLCTSAGHTSAHMLAHLATRPMGKQDNLPNATESKSILEASNSVRPSFSCRSLSLGSGEDTKSVSFWLTPRPRVAQTLMSWMLLFCTCRGRNHAADTAPVLPHFKLATFSPPAGKPRPNEH